LKNGPCGPCRNKKTLFSGVDFTQFPFGFHASLARIHPKNRLKYGRWKQLSTLIKTVYESGSIVAKDRYGQTVGLASLIYQRYLDINSTGDSLCSQA
jgi:hypothetical protein